MDRKASVIALSVLVSIAALSVGVAAYLKPPSEQVEVTPPPEGTTEFKDPSIPGQAQVTSSSSKTELNSTLQGIQVCLQE